MASTIEDIIKLKNLYGKKIYLLGTAEYGPVNTPIKASSIRQVISIFGNKGSLIEAYHTMKEVKLDCDIYLCKVTGVHSDLYLNINQSNGEIIKDGLYMKAKNANETYDNIKITLGPSALYIEYNNLEFKGFVKEYVYKDFNTVHELCDKINDDTRNLKGSIYCYASCDPHTQCVGALDSVNPTVLNLSGGNSGLYYNKNMYYNSLDEIYSILEGRDIDIIVPLEAYYDDTFTDNLDDFYGYHNTDKDHLTLKPNGEYLSFYEQLLEFCKNQNRFGFITHGIMGMSLIDNPFVDEEEYLNKLTYFNKLNKVSDINKKYKHLISVVVGDLYTNFGTNTVNGYIPYAMVLASLKVTDTTTNKPLNDTFILSNTFSNEFLSKVYDLGFTCFRYSVYKKSVVVSNGVTTSDDKNFKMVCNVRMCQLAMCYIRIFLNSYIGENIDELLESRALEQGILSLLESLVEIDIIDGYEINEIVNPITGHIFLDLSFKTKYMLEKIRAYSGLASK